MDTTAILTAVRQLGAQIEDLNIRVGEVKNTIESLRLDQIQRQLSELADIKKQLAEVNIRFDSSINAIDASPPGSSSAVGTRVASVSGGSSATVAAVAIKQNITDFFKTQYITNRQTLIDKGVFTEEDVAKIVSENQSKLEKKNDATRARTIATNIWRSLAADKKEIVRAMKDENAANVQKQNSTDVIEEITGASADSKLDE